MAELSAAWTAEASEPAAMSAVVASAAGRLRARFDALRGPRGALAVGSPQEVAEQIVLEHELFGHGRFLVQISVGPLAHADALRAIELLGGEVAPLVREELARRAPAAARQLR